MENFDDKLKYIVLFIMLVSDVQLQQNES